MKMELMESIKNESCRIFRTHPQQKSEHNDLGINSFTEKNVQNFYTPLMEAKLRTKPNSTIKKVRCLHTSPTMEDKCTNPESEGENGR